MLRLRRIQVHELRTVEPGTEVFFHDGVNVLLGKNGTGKTTLLELVSMCLRFNFSAIQDEPFDIEFDVEERHGDVACVLSMRLGTRRAGALFPGVLMSPEIWKPWARAVIRVGSDSYEYNRDGSSLRLTSGAGQVLELLVSDPPLGTGLAWIWTRIVEPEEQTIASSPIVRSVLLHGPNAWRFDESLELFERIMGLRYVHVSRPGGQEDSGSDLRQLWQDMPFAPRGLIEQIRGRVVADPGASVLMFSHEELPFLQRVTGMLGFESSVLGLSLMERRPLTEGLELASYGDVKLLFTRKGGHAIRHGWLSYGQKRLLALYYYLEANPHVLIADELLNGLYHEWIAEVMKELGERQIFLSSQSPVLLDCLQLESAAQVSRSFIRCVLDQDEQMCWHNMSAQDAEVFYAAYRSDIQHASEILRTKGLL